MRSRFERLAPGDAAADRIVELFQRTTQFNATGLKVSRAELDALLAAPDDAVYAAHVADRFADHGLVGAILVRGDEIAGLALSCRVLGLDVEHAFLRHVLAEQGPLSGRIVATARNAPVRNIYRDNGFTLGDDGVWRRS